MVVNMCVVAHPALRVILSHGVVGLERGAMTTPAPRTKVLLMETDPAGWRVARLPGTAEEETLFFGQDRI